MNGTSASENGCEDDLSNEFDTCDEPLQFDPWNSTVCEEWIVDAEAVWFPDENPGCYDACTGKLVQARTQFDCEFTYIDNGNLWKNGNEGQCMYNGSQPYFKLEHESANETGHVAEVRESVSLVSLLGLPRASSPSLSVPSIPIVLTNIDARVVYLYRSCVRTR